MPYLRFTRDNRGYENTYLMHAFRIRGRAQPRVLYWFRTPPGVRVGRSPLDEDAIRTIEESNPDLKFDWKRILQSRPEQPIVEPRRRTEGPRRRQRQRGAGPPVGPGSGRPQPRRGAARPQRPPSQRVAPSLERQVAAPPAPVEPSPIEEAEAVEEQLLESETAAEAEHVLAHGLDSESRARLRARYAEILARVSERTSDPVRQEELRAKAERLDPDAWVTAAEVRQGLEHYEQVYAEIRRALGRRRRRRRGRRRPGSPGSEGPPATG